MMQRTYPRAKVWRNAAGSWRVVLVNDGDELTAGELIGGFSSLDTALARAQWLVRFVREQA